MDPILVRYQALEDKVASYTPNLDTKRLFDAFTYADAAHKGQLRKSGEPYIIHPLAVACLLYTSPEILPYLLSVLLLPARWPSRKKRRSAFPHYEYQCHLFARICAIA